MSRGNLETEKLKTNLENQLNRLLLQLQDLDDLRDELDDEEIKDIKADTLEQMQEYESTLAMMMSGDMTLVDSLGSVQLAIQAAISQAFKTPAVIRMFAKKDHQNLRSRLAGIQAQVKMGKISKDQATQEAVEILIALKKLGESLTQEEQNFLREHRTQIMAEFDKVEAEIGSGMKNRILSSAATQIKRATT